MQSSQLDTASLDTAGRISFTNGKKYDKHSFIQQESMTVYPICKFATVEQLQLSVLKRGKKVSALTNKKHCICPVEKRLEHFLRTEEETYFLINGQRFTCVIQSYNKIIYLKLHKIVRHFCATL